ncbi:MAG: hypothetical protein CMM37_09655 [Rhodospirillaceae bacterium]|nr:hypothetical protein [Rhodospirillaceae bacterium]
MDNLKLYSKSLIVQSWKILCVDNSLIFSGSQTTWKKLFAFFRKKILRGSPRKFIIITIFQQTKGGGPMSHCLSTWSRTARIWIITADEEYFG